MAGLNFGLTTLDTFTNGNDILASPNDPFKIVHATLATVSEALLRGQLLYNGSLGTYTAEATYDDFKLTDYLTAFTDADTIPHTYKPVAVLDNDAAIGDTSGLVYTEGVFIKEKLTPDDVPAGVYGKITIVSERSL